MSVTVLGGNLFAGTRGGGVWYRPLSEIVTEVGSEMEQPAGFSLGQNYPNPFNPVTIIRCELPHPEHVTITVVDLLGREVARLVDARREAGVYSVDFTPHDLAGGVYFYRITAGRNNATKKMVLLK